MVGRISQVYENFSKVMLISNKESSFNGEIQEKEIEGIINGKGNSKLYFELLPKEKDIQGGENVVTSPLGGIFPKGLLVGQVKEVKKSDIEPFQQAEIKPALDIQKLDFLFIIRTLDKNL